MGARMNDRVIDLVNADIDGELSGPERAELNRVLLADPAVRALRAELVRTCGALDALEPVDVPADLHESIMAALPAPPAPRAERDRFRVLRQPAFRYAAAFAGGLLASALAFQAGVLRQDGLDSKDLSGTIVNVASDPSRIEVALPDVHGAITLEGTAAAPVVQTHLVTSRPIVVVARSAGRQVRLEGFAATQDAPVEMSAGFGAGGATDAPIEVDVLDAASGTVLQRAQLHSSMPKAK